MNNRGSSESMTCSCCKWKAKSNERLVELNKFGLGTSRANAKPPLPKVRLRRRGCLKGLGGKFTAPKKPTQNGSNSVDPSACLGYSMPKLSSGSESETPLSGDDDDGGNVGSSGNNYMKFEDAVRFSRRHDMAVKNVVLNELKNVHTSPLDGVNEHCLEIIEKTMDDRGPCEYVHTSDDACSSNSNSKNLTDSLSQIYENMELSCEHELESLNASDSAKTEQDTEAVVQVSTYELCSLLKRNESSYESLDGISVDDIENESIVDRLKRQVEHDRSCIKSLFKELEEERNAAAVAANETMAMITRLQDEKAALRMEALQYLRVVEETANDLLAEREKELEDMEYELEYYRNNESGLDEWGIETTSVDISQCLKELEKKVCMPHCGGNVDKMENGLNWKNKNRAP